MVGQAHAFEQKFHGLDVVGEVFCAGDAEFAVAAAFEFGVDFRHDAGFVVGIDDPSEGTCGPDAAEAAVGFEEQCAGAATGGGQGSADARRPRSADHHVVASGQGEVTCGFLQMFGHPPKLGDWVFPGNKHQEPRTENFLVANESGDHFKLR